MSDAVLVALADRRFLEQAKQLFSTVYWNSGWTGDYLLLAHDTPESDVKWFVDKGIIVKHCAPLPIASQKAGDIITASKCYLFAEYFKRWKQIVYLDVDILTRGPLEGLTRIDAFGACHSLGQTLQDNLVGSQDIPSQVSNELSEKFDLREKAFNSGVLAFSSRIIGPQTFASVLATFNKYVNAGLFGGDQLPFNLFFYRNWIDMPAAYNQIVALQNQAVQPSALKGLVIHCVSFAKGPWDPQSALYGEWKANYDKADAIELSRVPRVSTLSESEIADRSRQVVRAYFMGEGDRSLLGTFVKPLKLVLTNPARALQKARLLLKSMSKSH